MRVQSIYLSTASSFLLGELARTPYDAYPSRDDYQGIRVTPNICTMLEEIDTFAEAMERILKDDIPSSAAGA